MGYILHSNPIILHRMAILCMVISLELFSVKNQDARLWAVHIMVKLIMCRKRANRDRVTVNSAMILTGMARKMRLVAVQSLVAKRTYNVISVTSLVTLRKIAMRGREKRE